MPPRGKESFIRRQKEIQRQQRQKEKAEKRKERRAHGGGGGSGELSPDELGSIEELTGLSPGGGEETAEEEAAEEAPAGSETE